MFALPFFGDKPFWGRRVHALGVGPKPIEYIGETPDEAGSSAGTAPKHNNHHWGRDRLG